MKQIRRIIPKSFTDSLRGSPISEQRLQKFLANAGHGSRRQLEKLIEEGRVLVAGKVAELGQKVTGKEHIQIDGKSIKQAPLITKHALLAYHKPEGEICSRDDPEGRPTTFDHLPPAPQGRWIGIGRLDINSSGLLLFTTDGELANRLMHPSTVVDREYAVRVLGEVDNRVLENMRTGVELEDGLARFSDIQDGGGRGVNHWYYVVIQEGRNREVRRLWQSQGIQVSRLVRVRYGTAILEKKLRPGKWQYLDQQEASALYRTAGMRAGKIYIEKKPAAAKTRQHRKSS